MGEDIESVIAKLLQVSASKLTAHSFMTFMLVIINIKNVTCTVSFLINFSPINEKLFVIGLSDNLLRVQR